MISSVQVVNAPHTRRGFLERIFNPLMNERRRPYSLTEALREVSERAETLSRFGTILLYVCIRERESVCVC